MDQMVDRSDRLFDRLFGWNVDYIDPYFN